MNLVRGGKKKVVGSVWSKTRSGVNNYLNITRSIFGGSQVEGGSSCGFQAVVSVCVLSDVLNRGHFIPVKLFLVITELFFFFYRVAQILVLFLGSPLC